MSVYSPGSLLTASDILDAVYAFILAYVRPELDADNIIRGWENRVSLPSDTNDYAVMTIIGMSRIGTNVVVDNHENNDDQTIGSLRRIDVQLDFCSEDKSAFERANCIEMLARDPVSVAFFKDYGLSCLYADNLTSIDYQDGGSQQVHRYITTLHLSGWFKVTVSVPHAIHVRPKVVENVDAHHKVQ